MSLTVHVQPTDLVERGGHQLALLVTRNDDAPRRGVLRYRIGDHAGTQRCTVPHGESCVWLRFPAVSEPTRLRATVAGTAAGATIKPARPWVIHLVNHTHTDLGYVDYPPNVERSFYRYLLEALALIDETRRFPKPARYRWTIETAYHVRNFLRFAARADVGRLVNGLRRGVMDVSACYLNMTDLPGTDQVLRSFDFIRQFARQHDVPLEVGMACDINGLPWVYPAALHDLGVANLAMAVNADMARSPLARPRPFWWESADGKRILVWNGDDYCLGNRLGIDHNATAAMRPIAGYLADLGQQGYPYDDVLVLMSGLKLDCAPPTINPCQTVRDWNERFSTPQLQLTTLTQWFRQLRSLLHGTLPIYRGHWPDYWAFGLGSGADEVRDARETQHLLSAAGTAAAYVRVSDSSWACPSEDLEQAYEAATLASEHTWGAACSVEQPYAEAARLQWQHKRSHFCQARLTARLPLEAAIERIGRGARPDGPCVVVHNALPWERSGIAELELVRYPLPGYRLDQLRDPRNGRIVPCWCAREEGTLRAVQIPLGRVPPTGYAVLPIVPERPAATLQWDPARATEIIENKYYRVQVDRRTGGLRSLYDKQLHHELVRNEAPLSFGRVVSEGLTGRDGRLQDSDPHRRALPKRAFRRSTARGGAWTRTVLPGFFQTLALSGRCAGLDELHLAVRLYERTKRIDFEWRLRLPESSDPRAGYVAFPFAGRDPRVWLEVPGGTCEPGVEQIPTTCYDFYTVQNFVRVETGNVAVTLVPRDTPLIELNEISTFRFRRQLPPFNGTVVAWLYNNYWHTNFPASQPGEHLFRFSLTSGPRRTHNRTSSYRFAYDVVNPLRAFFLPQAHAHRRQRIAPRASHGSLVHIEPSNVMLVSVIPEGRRALLFRLQEVGGRKTHVKLHFGDLRPQRAARTELFGGRARPLPVRGRTVRCEVSARALVAIRVAF